MWVNNRIMAKGIDICPYSNRSLGVSGNSNETNNCSIMLLYIYNYLYNYVFWYIFTSVEAKIHVSLSVYSMMKFFFLGMQNYSSRRNSGWRAVISCSYSFSAMHDVRFCIFWFLFDMHSSLLFDITPNNLNT